jgi:hypothetical protein
MALPDILERTGLIHPLQFGGPTLIAQDIIGRAALTPTDLFHLNGKYDPWDKDAAGIAARWMARIGGFEVNTLIEKAMRIISERIVAEVVSFITTKSL